MKRLFFAVYRRVVRLFLGPRIGCLWPVNALHRRLMERIRPETVKVHGMRMFIDPPDSLGLTFTGIYERFETQLVKERVRRGDVVLDIGANIGYYTLLFSQLVGDEGKVFAFEPEPRNLAILRKNIQLNGLRNVMVVEKAVSNRAGRIQLHISEENWGDHRAFSSDAARKCVEVETVRVDDFLSEQGISPDFVKMDIQGSEALAIEGMKSTLSAGKPMKLVMEFWPEAISQSGRSPGAVLQALAQRGFSFNVVNEKSADLQPASVEELGRMREGYTNLFCVKS